MKKVLYSKGSKLAAVHSKEEPKVTTKKIYTIIWRDAYTSMDEWYTDESHDNSDYLVETTGYLIDNPDSNSNYYSLASTFTQCGHFCSIINIPKQMVISKKRLSGK